MSDPAGRLNIQLRRTARGLVREIRSTRPLMASNLFSGRTAAETAAVLPRLYSICSKAQSQACAAALEAATGLEPSYQALFARRLAVALETVREHLWRLLLDWPRLLGEPPDQASAAPLLAEVKRLSTLLDPEGRLFQLGTGALALDRRAASAQLGALAGRIGACLFGQPIDDWRDHVSDGDGFEQWPATSDTLPARLLRDISLKGEAALGRCEIQPLPPLDPRALSERLLSADAGDFIAAPTWDGIPRETTPFTRRADRGPLRALRDRHGNGLLPRLSAPLIEVAELIAEMRSDLDGASPPPSPPTAIEPGLGLGQVEAARGRLAHLARVERGRVMDYRILAPTEWNFHPEGALALALAALPEMDERDLARLAEHLILAIDPCVGFDLHIDRAASCDQSP